MPVTPWSKHELGEAPEGHYVVPLGKAAVRRAGSAVTILAYGTMVYVAQAAAEESGIDDEIIALRTLLPLDLDVFPVEVVRGDAEALRPIDPLDVHGNAPASEGLAEGSGGAAVAAGAVGAEDDTPGGDSGRTAVAGCGGPGGDAGAPARQGSP